MPSEPRSRRGMARAWTHIALALVLLEVACTTANPVMTFFFDGVPAPGETYVAQDVVKPPRRPPYKPPPPPVKFVEVPDLPPAIDWAASQGHSILMDPHSSREDLGKKLENITLEELGRAKKITVTKDNCTIVQGAGRREDGAVADGVVGVADGDVCRELTRRDTDHG